VDAFDAIELPGTHMNHLEIEEEEERHCASGKQLLQEDDPFEVLEDAGERVLTTRGGEGRILKLKRRLSPTSVEPTARTRVKLFMTTVLV
jgi:hypothetical protein